MPVYSLSAPLLHDSRLVVAAKAMNRGNLVDAEQLLLGLIGDNPLDLRAIRLLGELVTSLDRYDEAERLFRQAVAIAPNHAAARCQLALLLFRTNRTSDALAELAQVNAADQHSVQYRDIQAAAFRRIGNYDEALAIYVHILENTADNPDVWLNYGHMLKTVGRTEEGISAYRRALALSPALGRAWWELANLKTVLFDDTDIATMQRARDNLDCTEEDRWHLAFALGKAFEDRGDAATAFAHYAAGNAWQRERFPYRADKSTARVEAMIASVTPGMLGDGEGCPANDPVFVVGMHRAGSTLVEQILSSHSHIEGTNELPDISLISREIPDYPFGLARLTPAERRELGLRYLRQTSIHRHTKRPMFIDKMPGNWFHIALIRMILPRATIIDARRHPLGCCFSNFKQYFADGLGYSNDLHDMGRFYHDYVRLMADMESKAGGIVHKVIYEDLVENTEIAVRAMLAHCGLPFEEACLAFYRNQRAVRTPSSEQVRRPIYRDGVDAWKPFTPWLGPLRQALGNVLDTYPGVPEEFAG